MSAATSTSAQPSSTYVERAITISITLGEGSFGQSGKNTVTLSGLRCAVTVAKATMPSFDKAEIRVYGVTPDIMNAVTTLGVPLPMTRPNNTVLVQAGDSVNGMANVYQGGIQNAWVNLDGAPETFFQMVCWTANAAAMIPVPPSSFPGTADVATIMSGLATTMGLAFENGGVTVKVSNPYLAGTALQQAHTLARAANIELYIDSASNTLAIWPKNKTRGGSVPLISPASGLIGYPQYRDQGMWFRCLFNPSIRLGGAIQMQQSLESANGTWYVVGPFTHNLSAQMPDGPWFSECACARTSVPPASSQ